MIKLSVPYGTGYQEAYIPDHIPVTVVDPPKTEQDIDVKMLIEQAMDHPIGTERLENLVHCDEQVTIIVNDQTRPGPNQEIVDSVMQRLVRAGVPDRQICFVVATGSHRAPTLEEIDEIIGPEYRRRIHVHIHDCRQGNVFLGTTETGLPVWVDELVANSNFVIATGLIAPHHSAGFSGGRKSIVPGVAGLETQKIHHSLPIRPFQPAMGFYEENPFHLAALDAARMTNVRFIVNAVQNIHKQIIACVAGDLNKAHVHGVQVCREACSVKVEQAADLVITSPGGAPRDCNLYQSQKALSAGELFGKQGCTFIMCAEAPDGVGGGMFQQWMREANSPDEIIARFRKEGYNVGSNKAFMYARALSKGRVIVVTNPVLEKELDGMMLEFSPSLQSAVDKVLSEMEPKHITVLPRAVNMIPVVGNNTAP